MALTIENIAYGIKHDRLYENKDSVVAITGSEGDGKSSLAYHLATSVDPAFDLERNILYSPSFEETLAKIKGLPRYSAIIADEAIKALYKLRWQEKLQQYINILYGVCRDENKLSIMCMPRFTDFNEFFRQHRIRIWIWILDAISKSKKEGHAVVFSRSWNQFSQDSWNFKEMDKIIIDFAKTNKLKETEFTLRHKTYVLGRSRNFVGIIRFSQMPDDVFVRYTELKEKYKYEGLDITNPKENRLDVRNREHIGKLIDVLHEQGKTYEEIGNVIGVTKARVAQLIIKKL